MNLTGMHCWNHLKLTLTLKSANWTFPGFKSLISGLLDNSSCRFGYPEVTKHPFFADVDWTGLLDVVPPFVPIVNGEDDTSNFIEFERTAPTPSMEHFKTKKDFSGRNLPFVGFTYAKDIGSGLLDKSFQQSGVVEHLEASLSSKRKEVQELQVSWYHAVFEY